MLPAPKPFQIGVIERKDLSSPGNWHATNLSIEIH
ncbi:unnamed protein product [Rhodiola kirilowii]